MRLRNVARWAAAGAVVASVAAGAALAAGQRSAAGVTTIKAVQGPPKFKINRFVEDTLRWDKDRYTVKSGGTLHIVNMAAGEGPHTFTVLAAKDEPRTLAALFQCKICEKLGKAHGANPNSNAPPKYPFLENGVGQQKAPLVDRPGDSGITGKGKKGESIDLKVTAPAGTKLHFICLIHPWMQAEVDVT
jgi:uncharacterized cupredoxin-like copper-binding protein